MEFRTFTINKKGLIFQSLEIVENKKLIYRAVKSGIFKPSYIIKDKRGVEQLKITKPTTLLKMQFEIFEGGNKIAHINKESTFLKQKLQVDTKDGVLEILGNFSRNNYMISRGEEEIAKISRKGMRWKNYIGVAIKAAESHLLILAIVLAIELKIQTQNASG